MSHELAGYSTVIVEHFYQPSRKPSHSRLTELVTDPTGIDWNSIIAGECYIPQLQKGLLELASFDFYATMRSEMGTLAPQEMEHLREGMRQRGVGDPFLHVLLPDVPDIDKRILIQAGMLQFERECGKKPDVLWAPETALDMNVLAVAKEMGYKAIICAPEQITSYESHSNHPVQIEIPNMGNFLLIPFDRPFSGSLAFDPKDNADAYAQNEIRPKLLSLSQSVPLIGGTDGETFGHHSKGGLGFLEYMLKYSLPELGVCGLGINQLQDVWKPEDYVAGRLNERTAWSCPHGNMIRWHGVCGCDGGANGAWKEHFSNALAHFNLEITDLLNRHLPKKWEEKLSSNFEEAFNYKGSLNNINSLYAAKASSLAAQTSCGTFFGDPQTSGRINIMFVRQAIEHLRDAQLLKEAAELSSIFKSELSRGSDQISGKTLEVLFADLL